MLFPNERIGCYGIKVMKIFWSKRPQLEKLAFQNGLEIKRHYSALKASTGSRRAALRAG